MTGSQIQISAALHRLQAEKRYYSIAVYRVDGEYAIRIASAGASCTQCEKVHLSTGNIGRVARSGVSMANSKFGVSAVVFLPGVTQRYVARNRLLTLA